MTVEASQPKKQQKKAATKKAPLTAAQQSPAPQAPSPASSQTGYQGATGPANGYVARESATATKTGTPLIETPQSVSVVPRKQIEQQGAESVSDALHYTAGVIVDQRPASRYDIVNIRGLGSLQSFVHFQDGLKLQRGLNFDVPVVDPYFLERIEVFKGPSSVLYGQVGVGGLVNFVSKKPTDEPFGEVGVTFGTHERKQLAFDFGGPVDRAGKVSYRITGLGRETETDIYGVEEERWAIAPSLTWRPSTATTLTILGSYLNDPKSSYSVAVPALGSALPSPVGQIPHFFNPGEPSYDSYTREQASIGYLFEHQFDSVWTVRQNFRYMSLDTEFAGVQTSGPAGPAVATPTITRNRSLTKNTGDYVAIDNQAEAKFTTGALRHTVLAGIDHQRSWSDAWAAAGGGGAVVTPISYVNPVYGLVIPRPPFATHNSGETEQTGIYAQEQLKFGNWVALLGARYDWASYDYDSANAVTGAVTTRISQKDEDFTWRGGLLYNFDNGFAPYFSYSTSFEPVTGTALTAVDYQGNPFKPTTGEQYELGFKYEPRGFNAFITASVFDITLQNVLTPDPDHVSTVGNVYPCNPAPLPNVSTICQTQTGEVRTRGFEIEGRASLNENLDVVAAYTYLDTEITKSNPFTVGGVTVSDQGKRPTAIPEHMASFWAFYTFHEGPLDGFGFGGGVRYIGETYGNRLNTWTVDSTLLVDAAVSYDFGAISPAFDGYSLQVNAINVFDEEYLSSCGAFGGGLAATTGTNSGCYYGTGRNVMATLKYQW
ncbi:MAG: TonB-dependent siderophore receptor [Hyphomicrobium sp.]|nr:TonB-dependent siderophore receptor [Hyphomicrobium sp.]